MLKFENVGTFIKYNSKICSYDRLHARTFHAHSKS